MNEAYMRASEGNAMLGADLATAGVVLFVAAILMFWIGVWRNRNRNKK